MYKKNIYYIILCFCLLVITIGCLEKTNEKLNFDNIILESNVVELVNASMDFKYDKNDSITRIEVTYLFKNIVNHIIEKLNITIKFFDKDNNLIGFGGPKYIRNLPIGYIETYVMEANKIIYDDTNSNLIDHCVIIAMED